ncbi:hypothetical protein ACJIZ3_000517 [Penstemon smallii]|uniref:Uncharacterized protein n=1 Tax=Penstemon smallii TaxID=265156 RepID=A0ABD3R1H4_9LAMI
MRQLNHLLFNKRKYILKPNQHLLLQRIYLEFCKWLCRAAGTCDPLYVLCRNSLVSMLEFTDSLEKKAFIGFKDKFPFVKELAVKLSHDLMLSTESTPLLSDIRDFSMFLVLVSKDIEGYVLNCGPIVFYFRGEIYGLPVCVIRRRLSICMKFLLVFYHGCEKMFWETMKRRTVVQYGSIRGVQVWTTFSDIYMMSKGNIGLMPIYPCDIMHIKG